ncbi:unnamed protein product [Rhizophagus irregularis]|nr:unnamed protein product [Rhizophagus irregularis]
MLLSLNCLELGQTSNEVITMCIGKYSEINGVRVNSDVLTVANFKKLLLDEKELQGLTKMDIWKVELDLKSFKDTIYTEDEIKKMGTMMEPAYVLKEYFNDDKKPKTNYIHIFIVPTETSTEVKDISDDIVKELVKPPSKLPDKTSIRNFLNQKPDVKIPLSPANFSLMHTKGNGCISEEERDTYFEKSTKKDCTGLFTKLIGRLIFPSSVGKNEDSFHGFWDDIIKNTILTLGKGVVGLETMAFDRNTNKKTSTGRNRPDLVILVRNICPFRGEEKAENSTADVSKELTDKFKEWTYGDAPYLFAYYAIGQIVTFVLLTESESKNIGSNNKRTRPEVKSETLGDFNLRELSERLRAMNLLRNICRLLPIIVNLCPARDTPDFLTLRRENGTIVELGYHVKKIFKEERSVVHLKEIYATLSQNNVRFTDKLEHCSSHSVHLEPRGLQRKPEDLNELLRALICILTCLKEMHNIKPKPILHRDVRWPNIVLHNDKFILIDFDYATFGSERKGVVKKPLKNFSETGHAPETLTSRHNKKVDIWGVGHLIDSCYIENKPKQLKEFASKCQDKKPKNRPTASNALKDIIKIFMEYFPESSWLNQVGIA